MRVAAVPVAAAVKPTDELSWHANVHANDVLRQCVFVVSDASIVLLLRSNLFAE
jgi:hypothetical protein